MSKKLLVLFSVFALTLAACGPNTPPDRADSGADTEADAGDVAEDVPEDVEGDTSDDSGTDAADTGDTSDGSDTEEDVDSCTPKTSCESDECGDVDDGCGSTLDCGECPECQLRTDCATGANVNATCDSGSCGYSCESGFVDIDGDLGSDGTGCECEQTNNATEVCDGTDNDCDGTVDNNPEPQNCALTEGVCSGVQSSTCDSGDYVACVAADYGPDYIDRSDEDLTCDGLDNNCDGTIDNPCCGSSSNPNHPSPSLIGTGFEPPATTDFDEEPVEPAIVEPATNAVATGVATVAWASAADELSVAHVDESGNKTGTVYTKTVTGYVTGLELVRTDKGYDLLFARTERTGNNDVAGNAEVVVQQLTPDLQADGNDSRLEYFQDDTLAPIYIDLDASYYNRTVVVSFVTDFLSKSANAVFYRIDSVSSSKTDLTLDTSGSSWERIPTTAATDQGIMVAVVDSTNDEFSGKVFDDDGTAIGSFNKSVSGLSGDSLAMTWAGGSEVAAIFGRFSSGAKLSAAKVDFQVTAPLTIVDLASASGTVSAIDVSSHDEDGDGVPDSATIMWKEDSSTPTIRGGEWPLQTSQLSQGASTLVPNASSVNSVSAVSTGRQLFGTYQNRTTSEVLVIRASQEGVGLCN